MARRTWKPIGIAIPAVNDILNDIDSRLGTFFCASSSCIKCSGASFHDTFGSSGNVLL